MLFNIQKKSFWKVFYHYRKKPLISLIIPGIFIPFIWLGTYLGSSKLNFKGGWENFRIFTSFFTTQVLILSIFLLYAVQSLSGISQSLFQWRGKQKNSEEVYLLLFTCPFNRQTLAAAKMVVLIPYYFLISLIGLTLPVSLMLGFKSNLSLGGTFIFLILQVVFSLANFLFIAPPLFYFCSNYSFQNQLIAMLYVALYFFITVILIPFPLLLMLWLPLSLPIGIVFTYLYWKNVQNKDY